MPPTIIDIEASGFGSASYPIEVGVMRNDGEKYCSLIKPFDDWCHWDDSAEMLHGLSRAHLLEFGKPAREVCLQLNAFLGNQTAYSDGWVVDHPWLIKLFSRAGVPMSFRLSALEYVLNERQMADWRLTKQAIMQQQAVSRHRASADAEVIQKTFLMTAGISNRA